MTHPEPALGEVDLAQLHGGGPAPEAPLPSPDEERPSLAGAFSVLRCGLAASPELRQGLAATVALALAGASGRLVAPVLVQQILDRGVVGASGYRPAFVLTSCAIGLGLITGLYLVSRLTYRRLVKAAERTLFGLRVRAFRHIHDLSLAEQSEDKRGVLVARVTADVDTLAQFTTWGAMAWITASGLVVGTLVVMFIYSWWLTLIVLVVVAPLIVVVRALQGRLLDAYDRLRTRVGETLGEISESVMGAAEIRAFGLERRTVGRLDNAVTAQYRAQADSMRYSAFVFPAGDLFGALGMAVVVLVTVGLGVDRGLSAGDVVAFLFLVALLLEPIGELTESFQQTQTAVAGWRKVLDVLDRPIELVEPDPGVILPAGPLAVSVEGLEYAYRGGPRVLHGIDLELEPGTHVAVVGETGSGKTTFAKLLGRLADPTRGRIVLDGVDLRDLAPASRREAVRMVPQDGFLFDATVAKNVEYGRPEATTDDVVAAFAALELDGWLATLPAGLDTPVGERGELLSVGERQLVALARAQLGYPGLLVLDEATSAVDPATELTLTHALDRLSAGRTTVVIAHRLSTAQRADRVLVFDDGCIVEAGTHDELVAAGGVYAGLYQSWLGITSSSFGDVATPRTRPSTPAR